MISNGLITDSRIDRNYRVANNIYPTMTFGQRSFPVPLNANYQSVAQWAGCNKNYYENAIDGELDNNVLEATREEYPISNASIVRQLMPRAKEFLPVHYVDSTGHYTARAFRIDATLNTQSAVNNYSTVIPTGPPHGDVDADVTQTYSVVQVEAFSTLDDLIYWYKYKNTQNYTDPAYEAIYGRERIAVYEYYYRTQTHYPNGEFPDFDSGTNLTGYAVIQVQDPGVSSNLPAIWIDVITGTPWGGSNPLGSPDLEFKFTDLVWVDPGSRYEPYKTFFGVQGPPPGSPGSYVTYIWQTGATKHKYSLKISDPTINAGVAISDLIGVRYCLTPSTYLIDVFVENVSS